MRPSSHHLNVMRTLNEKIPLAKPKKACFIVNVPSMRKSVLKVALIVVYLLFECLKNVLDMTRHFHFSPDLTNLTFRIDKKR